MEGGVDMLSGFTTSALIAEATSWFAEIDTAVYVVAGLGIAILVANWVVSKVRARR